MKILVPLNDPYRLASYINAGADEFYFGFHDDAWETRFGTYADINRMSGFHRAANACSFREILPLIEQIRDRGKCSYVTMNANAYSAEQIGYIKEMYFPAMVEAGVDGVILSDINAIRAAVSCGLHPVASTMCAVYNTDIAGVYQREGVRRMILPRDLSLEELQMICRECPDVEFEAFFMRNGCIFSDSYCLGLHRPECGAVCTFSRFCEFGSEYDDTDFSTVHDADVNDHLYRNFFHRDACGMCALYRLQEIGITSLKIVGRADDVNSVCQDIALTRRNLSLSGQVHSEAEYLREMEFPPGFPRKCRMGMFCYYPEIRFGD